MCRVLACLTLVAATSPFPAAACINDNELPSHEREFRSQYGQFARWSDHGSSAGPRAIDDRFLVGAGAALLTAGILTALTKARARG